MHENFLLSPKEEEEEELRSQLGGAGVNKVSVRRTSVAIPQGSGVGCNTTSPFAGSRHYVNNQGFNRLTGGMFIFYPSFMD